MGSGNFKYTRSFPVNNRDLSESKTVIGDPDFSLIPICIKGYEHCVDNEQVVLYHAKTHLKLIEFGRLGKMAYPDNKNWHGI